MSLSDSCHEALYSLQESLVHYSGWDYEPSQLNSIINAMYELASFAVNHDAPLNANQDEKNESIDRTVVLTLLEMSIEGGQEIAPLLVEISRVNSRLSRSIDSIANKMTQKERLFDAIVSPCIFDAVARLKMLKDG